MSHNEGPGVQRHRLVLDVQDPPPDMRYPEFDDFQNREILKANGIGLSADELVAALDSDINVLQAAASHTLGEMGEHAATDRLRVLSSSPDDLVKVEAAYALARLGAGDGIERLAQHLRDPLEGYLSAPLAAGYLARLGDARGWPVIVDALVSRFPEIRMIAGKQLSLFLPFHGEPDAAAARRDVHREIGRALRDPNPDLHWQVLSQLRHGAPDELRPTLAEYASTARDDQLRTAAEEVLGQMDDPSTAAPDRSEPDAESRP